MLNHCICWNGTSAHYSAVQSGFYYYNRSVIKLLSNTYIKEYQPKETGTKIKLYNNSNIINNICNIL